MNVLELRGESEEAVARSDIPRRGCTHVEYYTSGGGLESVIRGRYPVQGAGSRMLVGAEQWLLFAYLDVACAGYLAVVRG